MSKIAFLFPGQGAQKAGMGKDFYEAIADCQRSDLTERQSWLDLDMKKLCFEEDERLNQTEYTQAALLTVCLAMEKTLETYGILPEVTAGLSLGEYCAIGDSRGPFPEGCSPYRTEDGESSWRKPFPREWEPWRQFSEWMRQQFRL